VYASADEPTMDRVADARELDGAPVLFARNRLAIIVEPGNPRDVDDLADLARSDVILVLCAPEAPCGRLAAMALSEAGVEVEPASLEENAKGVVSKVQLGEADAGIVYTTDVEAAGGAADGVPIESADDPTLEAHYLLAALRDADASEAARQWIDLVRSDEGQRVLGQHGFLAP
jgi:molybdate transport system substrate-binding protein